MTPKLILTAMFLAALASPVLAQGAGNTGDEDGTGYSQHSVSLTHQGINGTTNNGEAGSPTERSGSPSSGSEQGN